MPRNSAPYPKDEPLSLKNRPSLPGSNGKLRDNLLLLTGIALMLLATGMVLSNILA